MKNEDAVIVRILSEDEKNKIRPLYEEVFDDSEYFLDYYFGSYIKNAINFVCEENGTIVGMATIHKKQLMVSGKKMQAGYVYGVATSPEFRGKGIMRRILNEIFAFALENNYDYLYLIPVDPKIYEGLGYKLLRSKSEFEVEIDENSTSLDGIYVRKLTGNDIDDCIDYVSDFYKNRVSLLYDEAIFIEYIQRLSINNSGIYCIFDKICDRILGLVFIEDDGTPSVSDIICKAGDEKSCMKIVAGKLHVDKISYKLHDIMFKEVHSDLSRLNEYSICINDEV